MSQAIALKSKFENGQINVYLENTPSIGMKSTMPHVFPYGYMSVPVDNMLAEINQNSDMLQTVIGEIPEQDKNMSIDKGEAVVYSTAWRQFMRNNGIEVQQINTNKTAHAMMGEDTNKLISNLQEQIIKLTEWLQGLHTIFNTHVHSGVSSGIASSAVPVTIYPIPIPDDSVIAQDKEYTNANKNLTTNNYQPRGTQNGFDDNNTK